MSEVQSARRKDASYPSDDPPPVCESRSPTTSPTPTTGSAPASWNADYDKIASGVQTYDESIFGNPALVSAWPSSKGGASSSAPVATPQQKKPSGCTNVIPPAPPPLPPGIPKTAPNAYRTIQLTVIAENLPPSTRSVFDHSLTAGNLRRRHPSARNFWANSSVRCATGSRPQRSQ